MAAPAPTPATQPNTAAKELTAEERKLIAEAQNQSQQMLTSINQAHNGPLPIQAHVAALRDAARKKGEEDPGLVTVTVPKAFNLTLDGMSRDVVAFQKGTYPIPAGLADHWYLKANGVERYDGEGNIAPVRKVQLLSSNVFATDKGVDPQLVQDMTLAAFTMSGLDAESWNQMTNEQRGDLMLGVYETRRRMAQRAAEERKQAGDQGAASE